MKKYIFNGETYTELESLCQAFVANFEDAVEQVFIKPKKFVSFVKNFDKQKAKKVAEIFETTKYKGNVISFILFYLLKDPVVLVNGVNLDFNNFIKVIGINRENKAIKAFMEDGGMTRTYATMDIDKKLPNDSYYIEKTFEDDFTFKYISNYLRVDYTENLNSFISNILINDDERFKRACEIITSDDFQMVLAHKTNFKAIYNIRYAANPIFEAIKILSIEYSKDDLLKILDGTFFKWLLNNFDKYTYHKKETVKFKNDLKKMKKESLKQLTFDEQVELSKKLYETYLLFAEAYSKGEITVNKKFNADQYALDKNYCKTLICVDYMKDHPVRLTTEEELLAEKKALEAKRAKEEKLDEEDLDMVEAEEDEDEASETEEEKTEDTLENATIEVIKDEAPTQKELKLSEKRCKIARRMTKYIGITIFFIGLIIALIYFVLPMLPEKVLNIDVKKFQDSFKANEKMLMYLSFGCLGGIVFELIFNVVLNIRNAKSQKAQDLYYKNNSINQKDTSLNAQDKKAIKYFEDHKSKIYKRIKRKDRVISAISLAIAGAIYSLFIIIPVMIYKENLKDVMVYASLCASFGVGLLWGLLFKKKGVFSAFLINVVSVGLTIALLLFI